MGQQLPYREAIAVSRRGLELLATLPDTDERARQELRLRVTLGAPSSPIRVSPCLGFIDQPDLSLVPIEEALALAESTDGRMYEAELCRLRGERLLDSARASANVVAAETSFEQSLAIARQRQALSLELRAATSLARLRRDRARHGHVPVRDLILPVHKRFEEGLDTSIRVKHEACSICVLNADQ